MPEPGLGKVRIRVFAAGVGYVDGLLCQGKYQVKPRVPFIPCCEYAGVVDAIGAGVDDLQIGDRVSAQGFGGGLAEFSVVPAATTLAIPDAMSFAQAAIFRLDYATAYHAFKDRARLEAGERVLVLGASGGVGLAAIQVAKAMGATVIAAASTAEKRAAAEARGADQSVDYTDPNWRDTIKELTAGKGLDVIFDPVAGDLLEPAFRSLGWGGRHLVVGFAGGEIPSLRVNLPLLKGASLVGVDQRQFQDVYESERARQEKSELADMVAKGLLNPQPGPCFRFEDFRKGLESSSDRNRIGKTVIMIRES